MLLYGRLRLGLPAAWDGRLERLGRALTWPLRHGYQPAVMLALTLLGVLALVVGPAARRAVLRFGAASSREPWYPSTPRRTVGRVAPRAPWAWLTAFLPTYRLPRRPSPHEAPLVLATARSWWQRAVAAVTMAALAMAQTPARAESSLPAGCFYYHLADHLGSSNVLTYRDGLQAQHFENGVFGREVHEQHPATHQLSARYTGQLFDEETGLYYYGARYYDPELGRFTQADTLVPDPGDGQSLNRYSYANNNPLKYTDPSGHEPVTAILIGIAVGAALGAATTAATGGNVGMGILTGAIGGLFGGLGSALAPFGSAFAGAVSGSALGGAVNSAITGGNVGLGALSGAIAGAIGFGAAKLNFALWGGNRLPITLGDHLEGLAVNSGTGALSGGIGAEIQGGDFADGAMGGAIGGALASAYLGIQHAVEYQQVKSLVHFLPAPGTRPELSAQTRSTVTNAVARVTRTNTGRSILAGLRRQGGVEFRSGLSLMAELVKLPSTSPGLIELSARGELGLGRHDYQLLLDAGELPPVTAGRLNRWSVVIGHELGHAVLGMNDPGALTSWRNSVMSIENGIRRDLGITARTSYTDFHSGNVFRP
ncbi:MAG TPA: RHS repeat-associated core domain-containing protein [Verrucomicrobiota bacterium]|nr:RHS repeat-associated core domain-containing protein [Verrucomicrobiota bacterium]